ncbi:MAG: hypothetical protein LH660_02190 [Phormidesmis sp. CAN_BIN36]|nr:hypothetical protein [Phormidesmis sp. CAN_BIN36]
MRRTIERSVGLGERSDRGSRGARCFADTERVVLKQKEAIALLIPSIYALRDSV